MSQHMGKASEEGLERGSSKGPSVALYSGLAMREKLGIQMWKKFKRSRRDRREKQTMLRLRGSIKRQQVGQGRKFKNLASRGLCNE